jgi:hypothetical protein
LWYVYAQWNDKIEDSSIISPVCYFFEWEVAKKETKSTCSSITVLKRKYNIELKSLIEGQINNILSILENLYKIEFFTKTKEVIFLNEKSQDKLKVLWILEEFDKLKNDFTTLEKDKIQCKNIEISWKYNTISMNCSAFSAWFEKWFKWFDATDDKNIIWTSISIASSFINFIEKKSSTFTVVDKQRLFKSDLVLWEKSDFTNKTDFTLKLQYN